MRQLILICLILSKQTKIMIKIDTIIKQQPDPLENLQIRWDSNPLSSLSRAIDLPLSYQSMTNHEFRAQLIELEIKCVYVEIHQLLHTRKLGLTNQQIDYCKLILTICEDIIFRFTFLIFLISNSLTSRQLDFEQNIAQ